MNNMDQSELDILRSILDDFESRIATPQEFVDRISRLRAEEFNWIAAESRRRFEERLLKEDGGKARQPAS